MPRKPVTRRDWIMLAPALGAAAANAQNPTPAAPQRIGKETLASSLELAGLKFTDAQLEMMLPNINNYLRNYESLRAIDIPLDTEPAIRFQPLLPGRKAPSGPSRFRPTTAHTPVRPRKLEDLAFLPVTQLSRLIASGRVTPLELTSMYLERLKRHSPTLNCTITFTEELAMEQAARATREIKAGKYKGPLHGIPWGAKDLFATKGIRTTWGAEPFQNQVFDYNATVVDKLEKAGAVLIAKLSMGALAMGGLWFGGMTKTPWDVEQTSSGSSAGSASSTAAGLVGFALGTETLGSIVSPSTRCGVAGLRPTYGRVSRSGAMGLSWTMDKVGPICRTAEDCVLVLNAIRGSDGKDLTVVDAPLHWEPSKPLGQWKIGILQEDFDQVSKEQKPIYGATIEQLKKAGAKLEPVTLPSMPLGAIRMILTAEAAAAFDDLTRSGGVDQLKGQARGDWPNSFRSARTITAVEYLRAQRARTLLMRRMDELMSKWDVLVSPMGSESLTLTNLTGHPQMVVPCGFLGKMPQGLLFTGRLYEEGSVVRVAHAYEQSAGWYKQHPKLS
jgi:Asp-tRNA(Asn)/Glu-tRNA(Gln) amidotransferase A subunit family amidase